MDLSKVIVALDLDTIEQALDIVDKLGSKINFYKVGSIMFTRYGKSIIEKLKKRNKKIFLDLKYHDIPHTVANAVSSAMDLGIDMLTLHTLGGFTMLKETSIMVNKKSKELNIKPPILLGVTVLTSMKEADLTEIGINREVSSQVKKLAILAKNSGITGIVCSSREISIVKKATKGKLTVVVPGIRPKGSALGDQKRVMTPVDAINEGADYLVIGRPIIKADDPLKIISEIEKS